MTAAGRTARRGARENLGANLVASLVLGVNLVVASLILGENLLVGSLEESLTLTVGRKAKSQVLKVGAVLPGNQRSKEKNGDTCNRLMNIFDDQLSTLFVNELCANKDVIISQFFFEILSLNMKSYCIIVCPFLHLHHDKKSND